VQLQSVLRLLKPLLLAGDNETCSFTMWSLMNKALETSDYKV